MTKPKIPFSNDLSLPKDKGFLIEIENTSHSLAREENIEENNIGKEKNLACQYLGQSLIFS